ncbi:MAG: iron-sulfur cluster assembly accessory protein [Myxococcales bacterium]|nr:iron-sulfur cluster assembly accessory protein [Myxococcales bacterium]MCB9643939.1 iron-sulfur cluster assembly accessory protein [Myxococcales bacterium]
MAKPQKSESVPVRLTARAIEQVKTAIIREQAVKESGLRVLLVDAGNGYRYDLAFEPKGKQTDHVSTQGGLRIFVDKGAVPYLEGTTLDFIDNDYGGGFLFLRPEEG